MRIKKTDSLYASLAIMAVFGTSAFKARVSSSDGVELIALALTLLLSVGTLCATLKIARLFKNKITLAKDNQKLLSAVFFLSANLCLFAGLFSLAKLVEVCKNTVALKLELGIIILALIITVGVLAYFRKTVLLKFSGLFFVLCSVLIIAIFCFSFRYMSVKYLEIRTFPKITEIAQVTFKNFVFEFLPVLLPIVVLCADKPLPTIVGGGLGVALTLLTAANTILIFGSNFASELYYPYASAVNTVSLGELFSRMDAAVYPICFFPGIIRIAVQLLSAIKLFEKAKKMQKISIKY